MRRLMLTALLALVACAAPLTSGVVVDKGHSPAYDWTTMVPVYTTTCDPPPGVCTISVLMWVPMHHHEPDRWYLVILGDDGRRTDTVTVDQAAWDRAQVGDIWRAD